MSDDLRLVSIEVEMCTFATLVGAFRKPHDVGVMGAFQEGVDDDLGGCVRRRVVGGDENRRRLDLICQVQRVVEVCGEME